MIGFAIVTRNLVKRRGRQRALDGLSLSVPRGAVMGMVGANGAGKTTWMMTVESTHREIKLIALLGKECRTHIVIHLIVEMKLCGRKPLPISGMSQKQPFFLKKFRGRQELAGQQQLCPRQIQSIHVLIVGRVHVIPQINRIKVLWMSYRFFPKQRLSQHFG